MKKNNKTGVSMSRIIDTRSKEHHAIMKKNDNRKKERAKSCIECIDNKEGYCNKHNDWCTRVNHICLGVKNPYEYKFPKYSKKKKAQIAKDAKRKESRRAKNQRRRRDNKSR